MSRQLGVERVGEGRLAEAVAFLVAPASDMDWRICRSICARNMASNSCASSRTRAGLSSGRAESEIAPGSAQGIDVGVAIAR